MAASRSFKVPSMIAQDLSIIMGFVDSPGSIQETLGVARGQKRKGSPNIVPRTAPANEDDIASSDSGDDTESENEVEAEVFLGSGSGCKPKDSVSSDSDSDSSSDSSVSSNKNQKASRKRMPSLDLDFDEDGPAAATTYIPSTHELPPTAIPIPSLPEPSTLPSDPLQLVGEITTILPDSVIVRGGLTGPPNARGQKDPVLDEGSLLLFENRTPLGYVFETFGPTSLPHYIVRVKRVEEPRARTEEVVPDSSLQVEEPHAVSDPNISVETTATLFSGFDLLKPSVGQAIYHIPNLSNYVFPGALARLKGSDASNIHDEEPPEHELEFSDDEAEAAHKRARNSKSSRAPSSARSVSRFEEDETASTFGDDATSLYGTPPREFEDSSQLDYSGTSTKLEPNSQKSFDSLKFEDSAIQDALMHARNSRKRRISSASTTLPEAGSYSHRDSDRGSRERGRGSDHSDRGRGRGRGRGRERATRGLGRGRRLSRGGHPHESLSPGSGQDRRSSFFSFQEYDPHMPRPPSPTSLAIARATGQWIDGTPYLYNNTDVTAYDSGNSHGNEHQSHSHAVSGSLEPDSAIQRVDEHQQHLYTTTSEHQAISYGVAPHINPRFAHVLGFPSLIAGEMSTFIPSSDTRVKNVVESKPDFEQCGR